MQSVRRWVRSRGGYAVTFARVSGRVVITLQSVTGELNERGWSQRSDLAPTLLQASGATARDAVRAMQAKLAAGVVVWYLPAGKKRQRSLVHKY